MSLQYSPLCDSDRDAYVAYCAGFASQFGASEVRFVEVIRQYGRLAGSGSVVAGAEFAVGASGGVGGGWCVGSVADDVVGSEQTRSLGGDSSVVVDATGSGVGDGVVPGESAGIGSDIPRHDLVDSVGFGSGVPGDDARECVGGAAPGACVTQQRGKHYERNKKKRLAAKKSRGGVECAGCTSGPEVPVWRRKKCVGGCVEARVSTPQKAELQLSLEQKWKAENAVATLQAERKLRMLQAQDEDTLVKMQRAQVMSTTEKCKVSAERAFGFLAKTGNVPGVAGEGFVEGTVLTNATPGLTRSAGDTISPDSSASMHEYRQALKAVADAEKKIADLERALARLRIVVPEETAEAERYAGARTTFTLDTDGEPPVADEGFVGDDGKYHTFQRLTHPDWTPSMEKAMAKQGFDLSYGDYDY